MQCIDDSYKFALVILCIMHAMYAKCPSDCMLFIQMFVKDLEEN